MKRTSMVFLAAFVALTMLPSPTTARAAPEESDAATTAPDNGMAEIDLLVVYTRQARVEAVNIGALIRHAVDQTNQIFENSLIRARLRLVHSYQTDYVEDDDMGLDRNRLQSLDDGYLDEVHAVRDQYGADLVVLLRGRHSRSCTYSYSYFGASYAFSVAAHAARCPVRPRSNCIGDYWFAAGAIGLNLGAYWHVERAVNRIYPYGHAFCNDLGNWRTVMSSSLDRRCPVRQPYFSNPDVTILGTPAGDAETSNNARAINETAPIVANYRQPPLSPPAIPLVTSADNPSQQGFVRVINHSDRVGKVRIHAIDDEGRRFGPVDLSLDAKQTRHFNSNDLEDGNLSKGLSGGIGDGTGNWRVELETELDIEHLAYIRTPDGFLTSIHAVAAHANDGSSRHHVHTFNPAGNADQQSRLRVVNTGYRTATVEITGLDDAGDPPPGGSVSLTLDPGAAHLLTAQELERGSPDFFGQFGAGSGKWQLFVSSDEPIRVMSLLLSPTGNVTNLSP